MIARTGTEQLCKRYFQDRVALVPTLMRGCEGWVLTNAPGSFLEDRPTVSALLFDGNIPSLS